MLTSKRAFHGIPQNFYRLPALGTNPPSPTPSYHAPWSSNQTQPWPSQSEVATYHNKRLLCQPGVEILSCQNPSQQQHDAAPEPHRGSFPASRRNPSGLAKGACAAQAQAFRAPTRRLPSTLWPERASKRATARPPAQDPFLESALCALAAKLPCDTLPPPRFAPADWNRTAALPVIPFVFAMGHLVEFATSPVRV